MTERKYVRIGYPMHAFFSFAHGVKDLTLELCCILNSNYCPGWRDFKFIIFLKALATIWCTETSSM